jgi:hypothetical protein
MTDEDAQITKEANSKFTAEENFTFLVVLLGIVTLTVGMAMLLGPGGLLTAVGIWLLALGLKRK